MFFDFLIYQKFCLISMLSNLAETLHNPAKLENKQVATIWGLSLEKQKSGPKMYLPEGLEDTPFRENTPMRIVLLSNFSSI